MKKKLLAFLLAAIMVMTLLPTVAFAETEPATFTLELPGAKAVYVMEQFGEAPGKDGAAAIWQNKKAVFLNDAAWTALSVDSWSSYYAALEASCNQQNIKFTGSDGSFSYTMVKGPVAYIVLALTDATEISPGASYAVYYGTCSAEGGAITPDMPPIATGTLCTDASSNSGNANVKGVIDAADFGYELVIPADTILTEDDHEDVLLGDDGIVTIEVTKHGADNVDVSYTVDLTNGNLKDGSNHTIATTYKYKQGEADFATLTSLETKVTVYTGGEVVDSFVNVTADSAQWDAAPVGDYNATVVFNFEDGEAAPKTKTVQEILDTVTGFPTSNSQWMPPDDSWVDNNSGKLYYYTGNGSFKAGSVPVALLLTDIVTKNDAGNYTATVNGVQGGYTDVTFVMTNNVLTSIKIEQYNGMTSDPTTTNTYAPPASTD